jgi:hypothetical protein
MQIPRNEAAHTGYYFLSLSDNQKLQIFEWFPFEKQPCCYVRGINGVSICSEEVYTANQWHTTGQVL